MKNKGLIFGIIGIVLILFLIMFLVKKNSYTVEKVSYENLANKITKDGGALLYNGEMTTSVKKLLNSYYEDYRLPSYSAELTNEELANVIGIENITANNLLIIYMNGEVVDSISINEVERIEELINKYLYNKIPESEIKYKVLSTANEYIKKVNSDSYTIAVFGNDECTYCDLYLPIINNIADKYKLDIYYFNKSTYDEEQYEKIMALDFEIPAKCTTTNESTTMSKSFPKPMTIITKKGKFVDCIRGYVVEDEVVKMLKEYKIIKE